MENFSERLTNAELAARQQAKDLITVNNKIRVFADVTAIMAYKGPLNQLSTVAGLMFERVTSSRSVNNRTVLSVNGYGNQRWILQSKYRIGLEQFGVVVGKVLSGSQVSANTGAFQSALDSGERLYLPQDVVCVDGTIRLANAPVNLIGYGQSSIIRQMIDVDLLVIDQRIGVYEPAIESLCLQANGKFSKAVALTVSSFPTQPAQDFLYQKPTGRYQNIQINGVDNFQIPQPYSHTWKKGIVLNTPNLVTLRDILVQGCNDGQQLDGTVGIELNAPRASVETVLDNVRVYQMQTGLYAVTTPALPGLEGLHIVDSSFAGVWDGIVIGSQSYGAPGWFIHNTHIAARRYCVDLTNIRQGKISNCLFYHYGNDRTDTATYAAILQMTRCSDWHVNNSTFQFTGIPGYTPAQTPYGILIQGTPDNPAVSNDVSHNYLVLKPGDQKPAIWLQGAFATNNRIWNNRREGGFKTVLQDSTYNIVRGNSPEDDTDGYIIAIRNGQTDANGVALPDTGARMIPLSNSPAVDGYKLDVYSCRSENVIIPSTLLLETGATLKQIFMRPGQQLNIRFDTPVPVVHNVAQIRLVSGRSMTFQAGELLSVIMGQTPEEISRRQDIDGIFTVRCTPVDTALPNGNQLLDLRNMRTAKYAVVPSDQAGKTVTQILMNVGQEVVLQFDGAMTIADSIANIRLQGRTNYVSKTEESLILYRNAQRVEETARRTFQNNVTYKAGIPTATDVQNGTFGIYCDTANSNQTRLWANTGGTLKSVVLA